MGKRLPGTCWADSKSINLFLLHLVGHVHYSPETSLFVRMIAYCTDTSIPSWHQFKKFRHVQVEILHSQTTHEQPFPPPQYCARGHCNATDKSRITTRRFSLLSPPTMCLAGRLDRQHECPIDSFRTLCIIFWQAALSLYHNNTLRWAIYFFIT